MPFVLDASVAACWAFRDESHPSADLTLERLRYDQAHAPSLWWFEIGNILVVNERRRRLEEAESGAFLRDLSRFAVVLDYAPEESEVLRIARTHKLSVYDAAYLELALRNGIPLASLDDALIRAAQAEGIPSVSSET